MDRKLDTTALRKAVQSGRIQWRQHALERMLERGIMRGEVIEAISNGEIIEEYATDKPHPSALVLHINPDPLHVVTSVDPTVNVCHIITAYRPDSGHFQADFRTRKKHHE